MTGSRGRTPASVDVAARVDLLGPPRSRNRQWRWLYGAPGTDPYAAPKPPQHGRWYTEGEAREHAEYDRDKGVTVAIQYRDVLWFDGFTIETDWFTEPEES